MSSTATAPIPPSTFGTQPRASGCPCKSGGATRPSSIPRRGAASVTCASAAGHDPHTVLGVAQGATQAEIKRAYRRLALRYHPDVCAGDRCSARFQQIHWAYEALMSAAAAAPPAEPEEEPEDDPEELVRLDEQQLWEEWMGWEGAGTLDFSHPTDAAN